MATLEALVPWIFAFISFMLLVGVAMFEIVSLSDLENDVINPRDLKRRLNWLQLPHFLFHAVVTSSFLFFGRWLFLLLNLPLLLYHLRLFWRQQHLIDETEIFKEVHALLRLRICKMCFYFALVLLLMFRLIFAAFEHDASRGSRVSRS